MRSILASHCVLSINIVCGMLMKYIDLQKTDNSEECHNILDYGDMNWKAIKLMVTRLQNNFLIYSYL